VPSSVLRAQPEWRTTPKSTSQQDTYSPKFNGFDSSQSIQIISSPSHFEVTAAQNEVSIEPAESNSPVVTIKSDISSVQYPKLSVPSTDNSHNSQVSDRGRQPDYSIPGDDTLFPFDDMENSFLGDHDDFPVNGSTDVSHEKHVHLDSGSHHRSRHSSPVSRAESASSLDLPTLDEVFSTARSAILPKKERKGPFSDSLEAAAKIDESYQKAMEKLDAELDAEEDPEQVTPKASQHNRKSQINDPVPSQKSEGGFFKAFSRKTQSSDSVSSQKADRGLFKGSQYDGTNEINDPTPSQKARRGDFEIPAGSQQVDLTFSSDIELPTEKENDGDDSYDDDYGLPRGPGWVEKKTRRSRRQSTANSRPSSQTVAKARSSRRKTTTRF